MRNQLLLLLLPIVAVACASDDSPDRPLEPGADSVAAHVALMQRRIDANNRQDWDTWQALHIDQAVRTAPELDAPLVGAAQMRVSIEDLVATFPDYQLELVDAFGDSERLVARIHTHATMLGPLTLGETTIPPTGLSFDQDWVAVVRFAGDQIASIDEFHDNYGLLIQLGLASAP